MPSPLLRSAEPDLLKAQKRRSPPSGDRAPFFVADSDLWRRSARRRWHPPVADAAGIQQNVPSSGTYLQLGTFAFTIRRRLCGPRGPDNRSQIAVISLGTGLLYESNQVPIGVIPGIPDLTHFRGNRGRTSKSIEEESRVLRNILSSYLPRPEPFVAWMRKPSFKTCQRPGLFWK